MMDTAELVGLVAASLIRTKEHEGPAAAARDARAAADVLTDMARDFEKLERSGK